MGSNGKQHLDQITFVIIYNLQLQWTPMGSNGKHLIVQIILALTYILQLQWT